MYGAFSDVPEVVIDEVGLEERRGDSWIDCNTNALYQQYVHVGDYVKIIAYVLEIYNKCYEVIQDGHGCQVKVLKILDWV